MKIIFYFAVPPSLRQRTDAAGVLLCEFLDGAQGGHADHGCKFFDRFKVRSGWGLGSVLVKPVRQVRPCTLPSLTVVQPSQVGRVMLHLVFIV